MANWSSNDEKRLGRKRSIVLYKKWHSFFVISIYLKVLRLLDNWSMKWIEVPLLLHTMRLLHARWSRLTARRIFRENAETRLDLLRYRTVRVSSEILFLRAYRHFYISLLFLIHIICLLFELYSRYHHISLQYRRWLEKKSLEIIYVALFQFISIGSLHTKWHDDTDIYNSIKLLELRIFAFFFLLWHFVRK